jgi:hypothetical protein
MLSTLDRHFVVTIDRFDLRFLAQIVGDNVLYIAAPYIVLVLACWYLLRRSLIRRCLPK